MKGPPLTNAHTQHKINRRRDAAMPSPALQQQLSHSQRFVATRTPPSHHPIPCNPAAASTTPRLLKTAELDRPFAFLRPSPEIPPPFHPKVNQPVQRSPGPPCRLPSQRTFLPPLKPISSRSQRLCSSLFSSSSRRSVSLPCPPVRWKSRISSYSF